MKTNILFITESGPKIGYGHLYRSIALAKEFLKRGCKVEFVIDDEKGRKILLDHLLNVDVRELSFVVKDISSFKFVFLDVFQSSWIKYKELVESNVSQTQFVSIIDNAFLDYALETDYIFQIGFQSYNSKETIKNKSKDKSVKIYTGNDFFIFRDEFSNTKSFKVKKQANRVLVTMGGSDPFMLTEMVSDSLEMISFPLTIHYILGAGFDNLRIKTLKSKHFNTIHQIEYHKNINNIARIMVENDIAIINGGNTRFELTLLGVPFVSISFNEIQNSIANKLQLTGVGENLGIYFNITPSQIANSTKNILNNFVYRKAISKKLKERINNNGANKIYRLLDN